MIALRRIYSPPAHRSGRMLIRRKMHRIGPNFLGELTHNDLALPDDRGNKALAVLSNYPGGILAVHAFGNVFDRRWWPRGWRRRKVTP